MSCVPTLSRLTAVAFSRCRIHQNRRYLLCLKTFSVLVQALLCFYSFTPVLPPGRGGGGLGLDGSSPPISTPPPPGPAKVSSFAWFNGFEGQGSKVVIMVACFSRQCSLSCLEEYDSDLVSESNATAWQSNGLHRQLLSRWIQMTRKRTQN